MADVPVKKIDIGVSGGEGIKGIKRFGEEREAFEDRLLSEQEKLGDVERTYRKIGAYKKGGKVGKGGAGGMTVHNFCAGGKVISSRKY